MPRVYFKLGFTFRLKILGNNYNTIIIDRSNSYCYKWSVSRRLLIVCVLYESQFAWSCIFCSSVSWLGYGGICGGIVIWKKIVSLRKYALFKWGIRLESAKSRRDEYPSFMITCQRTLLLPQVDYFINNILCTLALCYCKNVKIVRDPITL